MSQFAFAGCGIAVHAVVARIQGSDHPLDGATLAARVSALHHDEESGPDLWLIGAAGLAWPGQMAAELEPQLEESLLGCGEASLVLGLAQRWVEIDLVQARHAATVLIPQGGTGGGYVEAPHVRQDLWHHQ